MFGCPFNLTTRHIEIVTERGTNKYTLHLIFKQQPTFDKRIFVQQLHCSLKHQWTKSTKWKQACFHLPPTTPPSLLLFLTHITTLLFLWVYILSTSWHLLDTPHCSRWISSLPLHVIHTYLSITNKGMLWRVHKHLEFRWVLESFHAALTNCFKHHV